ncbi:MAG: DUF192 domain-containing protein [Chloroflexota bacterium]
MRLRDWAASAVALALPLSIVCSSAGEDEFRLEANPDCARIINQVGSAEGLTTAGLPREQVTVSAGDAEVTVSAEVAATPEERQRGLMCRAEVPDGSGMLFRFGEETGGGFWMFNTYVPLDILYVDASGRVVDTASMKPCPREENETRNEWENRCRAEARGYAPDEEFSSALELPAGWLDEKGMARTELEARGRVIVTSGGD